MQLGIDLGTHVGRAAFVGADGRPRLVEVAADEPGLPAMARQTMHGLVIGAEAARSLAGNGETTVVGCTRLLGRVGNIPPEVLGRLPYGVREVGGEAVCNLLYAEVRAGEIYGRLVKALVAEAERTSGEPVAGVVLTVPASAEDRFRLQARAAVEAQGVRVTRLINQPTAALLAAQLPPEARSVAVVYCGSGSTDVSLAERSAAGVRVQATAGDMWLGGDDFVWAVAHELNGYFCRQAGVDVLHSSDGPTAALGLWHASEQALRRLSQAPRTSLVLDHGGGFGRDLATVVTRQQVESWLEPQLARVERLCRQALARQSRPQPVDAVVLVGEWVQMPALAERVAACFGRPVSELVRHEAPLLPVYGAALAATQAHGLVWDVTPYALGINALYDNVELFSPLIWPNTPIPTTQLNAAGGFTQRYQTHRANQTSVTLDVLQYRGARHADPHGAERVTPQECELLGSWSFDDLRPKRGERASFTVTFRVDESGILELCACETATGHSLTARVERTIG